MEERRRESRLNDNNEITITIISVGNKPAQGNIIHGHSKDISVSGVRIKINRLLPSDALLKLNIILKDPPQMITVIGKVRWIKGIVEDASYEAGLEFVNPSGEITNQLVEYILSKKEMESLDPF